MAETAAPDPRGGDAWARARATRVVVIGGGAAGLVAALEWAKIGAAVTVLEASDRFGGLVETETLDGLAVDLVADALPAGAAALTELLDELALAGALAPAAAQPVWVSGLAGGRAAPLPGEVVLGIPANAWSDEVRRVIGWRGAWRAYLDRLRPPLTIGRERSLGRLVRSRMGERVADRLVAPLTRGLYGASPDDIDVDAAAPGLSAALTRTGSLAGAVAELSARRTDASARATLPGGLGVLVDALCARLGDLGADLRPGSPVSAIARGEPWTVTVAPEGTPGAALAADVVVVATPAAEASRLLAGAGVAVPPVPTAAREIVTLVVEAPGLDAAPRGRAVYRVDAPAADGPASDHPASDTPAPAVVAVAHVTADWPHLQRAAGAGRHVLRVTVDTAAAPAAPAADSPTEEPAIARARAGAAELLGTPLPAPRAAAVRRAAVPPPASALGHAERVAATRAATDAVPGLGVVGAWISGPGLSQVVADAVADVDRMRRTVLWGGPDGEGDPPGAG